MFRYVDIGSFQRLYILYACQYLWVGSTCLHIDTFCHISVLYFRNSGRAYSFLTCYFLEFTGIKVEYPSLISHLSFSFFYNSLVGTIATGPLSEILSLVFTDLMISLINKDLIFMK